MTEKTTQLPRRAIPQPELRLYPRGDCGPCVLGGIIGLTPEQIYKDVARGCNALDYYSMKRALYDYEVEGRLTSVVTEMPTWEVTPALRTWGVPSWLQNGQWFDYVKAHVELGYYGIAMVNLDGTGAYGSGPDHWWMVCGVKEWLDQQSWGGLWHQEVLVSCSAQKMEWWIDVRVFLRNHGGFNLFLARPKE